MGDDDNDKKFFQILVVENDCSIPEGIKTTLWTRRKKDFPDEIQGNLPLNGALLKEDFFPVCGSNTVNKENLARNHIAVYLLKARKLSQLIAKSWLVGSEENYSMIRKIFLTANLEPDEYDNQIEGCNSRFGDEKFTGKCIADLCLMEIMARDNEHPPDGNPRNKHPYVDITNLILPGGLNWHLIRLSLLTAGLVYKKENNKYEPISEPITSNYEISVQYAFELVDWSVYTGASLDFAQPGKNQRPPYLKVSIPYPPILTGEDCTSLKREEIKKWAEAQDEGGNYPFYPKPDSGNNENLVTNVTPPFPYMPPSTL